MKKLLMLCLAFFIAITVSAQNTNKNAITKDFSKKQDQKQSQKPKKLPIFKTSSSTTKGPTIYLKKELNTKEAKSVTVTLNAIFDKKRPNTENTSFIYPKYQAADTQTWKNGCGHVNEAKAQVTGYVAHDSYSYNYGETGSRCWNIVSYKPEVSGTYRVTVEAYQEGNFKLNVSTNGQQAYAYRLVGINVYGLDYNTNMLDEQYLDSKDSKKTAFKETGSVSKEYYFQAGKSYTLIGYTEVGGWSNGDDSTWYRAKVKCAIGSFKIDKIENLDK
jgi:hypothetical protein